MIPSTPRETAENIKKHIDGMAEEIGRRVHVGMASEMAAALAKEAARGVLLEWFLGEWLPEPGRDEAQDEAGGQDQE